MTCREVMTADPQCCLPDESAARIAKLMKTEDIGSVPICEDRHSKKLVGIVTDRDLAIKVIAENHDGKTKARDVMSRPPITCRADDDLENVLKAMERHQVRRIPIVDDNQQLIGIIAQADIAVRYKHRDKTGEVVEEISRSGVHA